MKTRDYLPRISSTMKVRLTSITRRILSKRSPKMRESVVKLPRPPRCINPILPKIWSLAPCLQPIPLPVVTPLSTPCSTSIWHQGREVYYLIMAGATGTLSTECMGVNMDHHPLRHMVDTQHMEGRSMLTRMRNIMDTRSSSMGMVTMERALVQVFEVS